MVYHSETQTVAEASHTYAHDQDSVILPHPSELISPAPSVRFGQTESRPFTAISSALAQQSAQPRIFHSRRVRKEEIQRPWLEDKDPRRRWQWILPICGFVIGIALTVYLVYNGYASVPQHKYCPVLDEDFSSGTLNPDIWTKEVQVGGFGNGVFDMTTSDDENAYIQDGQLYIKPTLQDPSVVNTNHVLNLLNNGCTGTTWSDCVTATNTTNGTIINPVKSARINTKKGASIKYGRVEVVAQLPAGDWLWPAIWLLPNTNTYGPWPASGEIDIVESRGNNKSYPQGGNEVMYSTLHWGPDPANDGYEITTGGLVPLHSTLPEGFHTFGLEWSEKYMFMYMDSRLQQVLYMKMNKPFWSRGNFPASNTNGSQLVNPWGQTGRDQTPFDQEFYLILNVAVGGTNGWFPDGMAGKPWVDASPSAKLEFWNARDQWYPTWADKGHMTVKSVKMWQQQGYNGC